jgi:hypothetical protein
MSSQSAFPKEKKSKARHAHLLYLVPKLSLGTRIKIFGGTGFQPVPTQAEACGYILTPSGLKCRVGTAHHSSAKLGLGIQLPKKAGEMWSRRPRRLKNRRGRRFYIFFPIW